MTEQDPVALAHDLIHEYEDADERVVEIARAVLDLAAKYGACDRCGSTNRKLDADFHCSTCYREQTARGDHLLQERDTARAEVERLKKELAECERPIIACEGFISTDKPHCAEVEEANRKRELVEAGLRIIAHAIGLSDEASLKDTIERIERLRGARENDWWLAYDAGWDDGQRGVRQKRAALGEEG